MADKSIDQLNEAEKIYATDLFVLQQSGSAKKLTGQVLLNWLTAAADGHGGIQSITKLSTSGLVDTYRITLADTTTFDFVVTNGRSINSIAKTSTSGLVDTYTISYNNGTTSTFTVKNGEKGDKGDNAYVWIKYASQKPTESSHSIGDIPDDWIGIYSGKASTAPTDWKQYQWFKHKGEQGDTGAAATLANKSVTYQVSDSGTIIPSGAWGSSVPVVSQGKYLWTKTELQFNTGDPIVSYSIARMGIDGSGSVSSVCNVSPDADGNVTLTAENVGAMPDTGGDLTGELRMNGQPISGLNEPTEGTQAAPKSYVDKRVPLDGSVPMTGNLSMGGNKITNLADPEDAADAATKGYADTKASLPKTASGTVIALSDASDGPLQGLRIYGKTTQDGTPTPDAPVELVSVGDGGSVGVTVAGKNLLMLKHVGSETVTTINTDGSVTVKNNSEAVTSGASAVLTDNIPAGRYTITNILGSDCFLQLASGDYSIGVHVGKSLSFDYNGGFFRIVTANINAGNSVTYKIQLERGDKSTSFEPYINPQTLPISTPNGLPGIPVTSGGNYTDADGQQWICDEVDFARGVYVQRIQSVTLTGAEAIKQFANVTGAFQLDVLGGVHIPDYVKVPTNIMCNYYQPRARKSLAEKTEIGVGIASENGLIIYDDTLSTATMLKNKLSELYSAGNPVKVLAILKTPVETPIPADELAAYAALHTNKPNTTIYNDAGAYMDVGYYPPDATMRQEDIKEYVDAKHFLATVSLPAASWAGGAAPYTQTVPVPGILATDFPHVTPVYSSTLATALAQKEAWSMVNQGVPGAGEITFTCFDDKPATEIPIQIEVMR